MPKIGARMMKTAIAVFLCFVITLLRGSGIPFYSAIAAVLCTQPELDDSKAKGKSRIIATFIGGFAGMILLFFLRHYVGNDQELLRYAIISLMLIPLIYLTVLIKQPASSYLTCVVFMCVTVSHAGDSDPVIFAINRMIDTLIGIFVALGVNAFHLPHHKHKDVLLDVPLAYLLDEQRIATYTRIHLNRLIKEGARIMVTSSHTPAHILQYVSGIKEPLYCVLMDGVVRYDRKSDTCVSLHTMPYTLWHTLEQAFYEQGFSMFLYECKDELLYIHHGSMCTYEDEVFYSNEYKLRGQSFHIHEERLSKHLHCDCVMMMVIVETKQLETITRSLEPFLPMITWVIVDHPYLAQYKCLRLYSSDIAKHDPAEVIQALTQVQDVYKVRHQGMPSNKAIIKELSQVFYRGKAK